MGRARCRTTKSRRSRSESAKQSGATGLSAIGLAGLPVGLHIILARLQVSGLNDKRQQAVDSMVAGWEVEVLHQGSTALLPGTTSAYEWPLEMATSESRYKVTFKADRAMQT